MTDHIIEQDDILGFEKYAQCRPQFRKQMMATRKLRSVSLTDNLRVVFENKQTVQYQIEEILYSARSSCATEIQQQIGTYQHLLPSGQALKATLLFEFPEASDAEYWIANTRGLESTVFLQIEGFSRIWPFANQDLCGQPILSAVHYLHYDFTPAMIKALNQGTELKIGIAHPRCPIGPMAIPLSTRLSLLHDLTLDDGKVAPHLQGEIQ